MRLSAPALSRRRNAEAIRKSSCCAKRRPVRVPLLPRTWSWHCAHAANRIRKLRRLEHALAYLEQPFRFGVETPSDVLTASCSSPFFGSTRFIVRRTMLPFESFNVPKSWWWWCGAHLASWGWRREGSRVWVYYVFHYSSTPTHFYRAPKFRTKARHSFTMLSLPPVARVSASAARGTTVRPRPDGSLFCSSAWPRQDVPIGP